MKFLCYSDKTYYEQRYKFDLLAKFWFSFEYFVEPKSLKMKRDLFIISVLIVLSVDKTNEFEIETFEGTSDFSNPKMCLISDNNSISIQTIINFSKITCDESAYFEFLRIPLDFIKYLRFPNPTLLKVRREDIEQIAHQYRSSNASKVSNNLEESS